MTKSFSLSLVVAGACLAGTSGCTASTDSTPADNAETTTDSATEKVGAQKRTPSGTVNAHAAAARPAEDVTRRTAVAPASASGPSHAVRSAQPTASAANARTAATSGAMAKPAVVDGEADNDIEIRGARVSRAVPAPSADGRVDNAARMLQLATGEGENPG